MSTPVSSLLADLLQAGGAVTTGRPAQADARRLAWAREMERAQCDEWFKRSESGAGTSMPRFVPELAATAAALAVLPVMAGDTAAGDATIEADGAAASGESAPACVATSAAAPHGSDDVVELPRPMRTETSDPTAAPRPARASSSNIARAPACPTLHEIPSTTGRAEGVRDADTTDAARLRPSVAAPVASLQRTLPVLPQPPSQLAVASPPAQPTAPATREHHARALPARNIVALGPALAPRAPAPVAPVRMHVEWQGDTAHIWLGVDPTVRHHLPELVQTLSNWLRGQGLQLRGLVCNGQVVVASAGSATSPRHAARLALDKNLFTSIDIVAERES